jgi:indole-3-glycerol phosphate synthase
VIEHERASADLLATVVAAARRIVGVRAEREPLEMVERRAGRLASRAGRLRDALERSDRTNIIAECKRRSPVAGVLRREYDPAAIALEYAAAGAAAVSVLTEPTFFDGSLDHLRAVRDAVTLPVLRKDFIVTPYQVFETKAAGADALLLIVAALTPRELAALTRLAADAGLDALVEVHDERELASALEAGATIVGVNNRNLRTLTVDVGTSEALIASIPGNVTAVSESGLRTRSQLVALAARGYRGFLIGGRLMTAENPGRALAELTGTDDGTEPPHPSPLPFGEREREQSERG